MLFSVLCKAQETKYIDSTKYKIEISQWSDNNDSYAWFNKYLKDKDNTFSLLTMDMSNKSEGYNNKYYFIKLNYKLDTICKTKVKFTFPIDDYIETEKAYYTINVSRNTMNEDDGSFLCKYNKKWQLIWEKKIRKSTAPDDDFVLSINDKNELIIVSDDDWFDGRHTCLRLERRNVNGNLISQKTLPHKNNSKKIHSLLKTSDKNFLIVSNSYDIKNDRSYLELTKISQTGNVIWQKQYSAMKVEQALITREQSIVVFGNSSIYDSVKNEFRHSLKTLLIDSKGKLIFEKKIENKQYEYEANCVNETSEGNFVYASYIKKDTDLDRKIYLFELNKKGEMIFEKSTEDKPTTDLHIFKNTDKDILLANSYYTPNWYYKHNVAIQFIKLSK